MGSNGWDKVPIKELYEGLYDGPHATPKTSDEGPVFLGIKNVTDDGRLDLSDIRHIAEDDFPIWTRRIEPKPNDLVFTYEATLNRYAIIPTGFRGCLGRRMALIRTDPRKVDVRFLFYYFFTEEWRAFIKSKILTGSTVDRIPLTTFPDFPVSVPPLLIQQRIADILSAYDRLIENSHRRIQILEEMAHALYREWFVHFRFPGHEKLTRVASPLGKIPKGWEGRFGDLATINRDSINPFDFPSVWFEHFSIPSFDNGRQPSIELGDTILSGKYCIDASCVLLSKLNPRIPRIWLPIPSGQRRAITSTEFLVLKPKSGVTREFIYSKCCSAEFAGQFGSLAIGTSTSHQRVKPENLLALLSAVPDQKTIAQFTKIIAPMLAMSQQLRAENQILRRTRDLLLPRLLSGQVNLEGSNG
jgi:type I restriction enzyme, S subunit